jgi:putative membrane protein
MKLEKIPLESILPGTFVEMASLECMSAIQLGHLAVSRAGTDAVRRFAAQMIADCGKTLTDISSIAARKSLAVPQDLDEDHQRIVQQMSEKAAADFDSAYAVSMVEGHQKATLLYRRGQRIKNPDISALASRALIVLEARKRMINSLVESIAPQDWTVLANPRLDMNDPRGAAPR